MRLLCLLIIVTAAYVVTPAQYCNPASVSYIVRDEKGNVLSEAELQSISEGLPKTLGDATIYPGEVSLAGDGSYYWPESVEWSKGKKQPALDFSNAAKCTMFLAEVTLTYHDRRMHLLFNLNVGRGQPDQRLVVDSLRFQEGTFILDMTNWRNERDKLVPAARWKKFETGRRLLEKRSG